MCNNTTMALSFLAGGVFYAFAYFLVLSILREWSRGTNRGVGQPPTTPRQASERPYKGPNATDGYEDMAGRY